MPRLWVGPGRGVRDPLGKHERSRTGGSITITQITEETPMYTSETAIYADSEGNVVPEDSPDAAIMVVAAGGTITDEEAAKYGLTDESAASDEGAASKVAERSAAPTEDKGPGPDPQAPTGTKPAKK
jgi:hypothetical protein